MDTRYEETKGQQSRTLLVIILIMALAQDIAEEAIRRSSFFVNVAYSISELLRGNRIYVSHF